ELTKIMVFKNVSIVDTGPKVYWRIGMVDIDPFVPKSLNVRNRSNSDILGRKLGQYTRHHILYIGVIEGCMEILSKTVIQFKSIGQLRLQQGISFVKDKCINVISKRVQRSEEHTSELQSREK